MNSSVNSGVNQAEINRVAIYDMLFEIISCCFRESPGNADYYSYNLKKLHNIAANISKYNRKIYSEFAQDLHDIRNYIQSLKNSERINSKTDMERHYKEWQLWDNEKKTLPANVESKINNISDRIGKIAIKNVNTR